MWVVLHQIDSFTPFDECVIYIFRVPINDTLTVWGEEPFLRSQKPNWLYKKMREQWEKDVKITKPLI